MNFLKTKIYLVALLAIFGLLIGNIAMAQYGPVNSPVQGINPISVKGGMSVTGLVGVLSDIVTWIWRIFFIVAVMFVIFAAFTYLTAGGDPEKVGNAKTQIIYAAVAIIVALLAVSLSTIVQTFLSSGA